MADRIQTVISGYSGGRVSVHTEGIPESDVRWYPEPEKHPEPVFEPDPEEIAAASAVKLCLWCQHFEYNEGWGGSTWTGSEPDSYDCGKGHWCHLDGDPADFRATLRTAKNCPDYELSTEIIGAKRVDE